MATQQQLMEQLVLLTDAVRDLAQHQVGARPDSGRAVTDADQIRQRVAFSYQALGALTGRTSSGTGREFDVQIVAARRRPDRISFRHLPADADWVELRSGSTVETLRIQRRSDSDTDHDRDCGWETDWDHDRGAEHDADHNGRDGWRRHRHHGHVHPRRFRDPDPIGSMVFLRDRHGPLLAFGPRLGPLAVPPPTPQPPPYPPTGAEPAETIPEA